MAQNPLKPHIVLYSIFLIRFPVGKGNYAIKIRFLKNYWVRQMGVLIGFCFSLSGPASCQHSQGQQQGHGFDDSFHSHSPCPDFMTVSSLHI